MRMKLSSLRLISVSVLICLAVSGAYAAVSGTAHDFSPGKDGSMACQFCHTPHNALAGSVLWNHKLSDRTYEIYWSTSLDANVGQPTGSSKLCLSCHDGTVALDATISGGGSGSTYMPPGSANFGTDLSDDHPVSFVYSSDLSSKDPQIKSPESLSEEFHLDQLGEMQCMTCHDPHDDTFGNFLVTTNVRSNLCVQCHNLTGWTNSVHANSVANVKNAADTYLVNTDYSTVADNGCLSCHKPHSAGGKQRLLHFSAEENNCISCHNGLVAKTDIAGEIVKISGHFVQNYEGVHDITEIADNSEMHVECVDCHNPHAMVPSTGSEQAPFIQGVMKNVSGVSADGSVTDSATYEYEVCFKCHGNNPNRVDSQIPRQITQTNTLMEFEQGNPSYHPVTIRGTNPNVPSLLPGLDETSVIYCTDCHSSDSSSQVKGPHGSQNEYLLSDRYETADDTRESPAAYALCYKCHDRESILNNESFADHKKHIMKAPCSVCHDPHGISSVQGNSMNNSNLINFDTSIVFPDSKTGRLEFEDLGDFRGQCFLECHNKKHSPKDYGI